MVPDISLDQATEIARWYVASIPVDDDDTMVLLEGNTVERPFGWVFSYANKKFVDTGDRRQFIYGNAPIIVDRADGSVHLTGTSAPVEKYIEEYEKRR